MGIILYYIGRQISSRYLRKDAVSNPSVPLPSEVERDKPAVTVGNTSTSHDIVTSVTAPTTPTTTSTTSSSKLPRQTFEVGDMIRVKGAEDKGGGVVKWIGSLSGSPLQVAGLEMVSTYVTGFGFSATDLGRTQAIALWSILPVACSA